MCSYTCRVLYSDTFAVGTCWRGSLHKYKRGSRLGKGGWAWARAWAGVDIKPRAEAGLPLVGIHRPQHLPSFTYTVQDLVTLNDDLKAAQLTTSKSP